MRHLTFIQTDVAVLWNVDDDFAGGAGFDGGVGLIDFRHRECAGVEEGADLALFGESGGAGEDFAVVDATFSSEEG